MIEKQIEIRGELRNWKWLSLDRCTLCDSPNIQTHYTGAKLNIPMSFSRCSGCTGIFQNPRPTPETMAQIFGDYRLFGGSDRNKDLDDCIAYYDYSAYENALSRNAVPLLRKIARHVPPPARLLEIGGATGWFLNAARTFGYDVQGLDISPTLASIVKDRYCIDVTVDSIETTDLPSEGFDVICNFGGIECWTDARRAVANVHRMLGKNGIFFFNYIDSSTLLPKISGKKYYNYNPGLNYFFNKRTMRRLLGRHGFNVLSEKMPLTHISLGPLFHYLGLKGLFRLSTFLRVDKFVFILPNIQARTIVALKP